MITMTMAMVVALSVVEKAIDFDLFEIDTDNLKWIN